MYLRIIEWIEVGCLKIEGQRTMKKVLNTSLILHYNIVQSKVSFVVLVSDVGTCFIIHLPRFENTCFSMVLTKVIVHDIGMEKTILLVHNQVKWPNVMIR